MQQWHTKGRHQCTRAGPAVDYNGFLAPKDAAVAHAGRCFHKNAAISALQQGQQWITALTLLRKIEQWHMKAKAFT